MIPARRSRTTALLLSALTGLAATALLPTTPASAAPGDTSRVSIASDGSPANGYSGMPLLSADGHVVTFTSLATNLVAGTAAGANRLFARDRRSGISEVVSVSSAEEEADGMLTGSVDLDRSGDTVLFGSAATNLSPPGEDLCLERRRDEDEGEDEETATRCYNLFARHRTSGTTEQVSVALDRSQPNGNSSDGQISGDGRYVVFQSSASNLVAGDDNDVDDVFVRDLESRTTTRLTTGGPAGNSYGAAISADGRWVAFLADSAATDSSVSPTTSNIFLHDLLGGVTKALDLPRTDDRPLTGAINVSLSGDGQLVGFTSQDSNLVAGDTYDGYDVFLHDRVRGTTTLASRHGERQTNYADRIHLSEDGTRAVFRASGALLPGLADKLHIYVRDVSDGSVQAADLNSDGQESNGYSDVWFDSITADGSQVAFSSTATNLGGPAAEATQLYVRELTDGPVSAPGDLTATVRGGDTVTTGASATLAAPVQTSIVVPSGVSGTLTVDAQPSSTAPAGYSLFGQQLVIEGPAASVDAPYTVSFTVDQTQLNGLAPADVQVWRDGEALRGCTDEVKAIPDPCIFSRGFTPAPDDGGDAVVTVRTSHFSTWTLGRLDYDLAGPLQPVDAYPTANTAKAGSAVPVRFRLGGDKGLNVISTGYPKTLSTTCGGATDEVEQTLPASSSALTYDAVSATYTYTWKTAKIPGCIDVLLKMRDGSELRAKFKLR